jgi:hypothetical protein
MGIPAITEDDCMIIKYGGKIYTGRKTLPAKKRSRILWIYEHGNEFYYIENKKNFWLSKILLIIKRKEFQNHYYYQYLLYFRSPAFNTSINRR